MLAAKVHLLARVRRTVVGLLVGLLVGVSVGVVVGFAVAPNPMWTRLRSQIYVTPGTYESLTIVVLNQTKLTLTGVSTH